MPYIIDIRDSPISALFKDARIVDFVRKSIETAKLLEIGTYEKLIYDSDVYSISHNSLLKENSEVVFESHKEYIDVHIIVCGIEGLELIDVRCMGAPYEVNTEFDYCLYKPVKGAKEVVLDCNSIAVMFYEDVHKTDYRVTGSDQNIVKVVLKLKKDIFDKEFNYG